jgi:hypothetical protein
MSEIIEVAPGVTEELMVPEFVNSDWLTGQPEVVYRLDMKGRRYYYVIDEETGEPSFFESVTSFIKSSLPTPPQLIDWIASMGKDKAREYAEEAAHKGTFLHMQCGELLMTATYDLDALSDKLNAYREKHHLPHSFMGYADELKKDVLSFSQFILEKDVVPIAVEIVLTDKERALAGALDIVCEMDFNKKRVKAIVDIKSGKKGVYESAEIQLHEYWNMWRQNFPDIPVEAVFNWSPKDWRGAIPSYSLKNQTKAKSAEKLEHLVALSRIQDAQRSNTVTICHGQINLKEGLYNNIDHVELADVIRERHSLNLDDEKEM